MARPLPLQSGNNAFDRHDHGHHDSLTALDYNQNGERKVTGSTDHRLKVFNRQADGSWKLLDTWIGHDAEVLNARWVSPSIGQLIGSIGEDQRFKIWEEDFYEPPNSGHRFKCIFTLQSPSRIPYVSFDFTTINHTGTYLALLSRDALLSVYEADEPDSMSSWILIDQFHVCTPPVRGQDTSFKVQFEPNPDPSWSLSGSHPRFARENLLSLITAGMNTVKIWRTRSSSSRTFHLAADMSIHHHGLVRDVSWALFNTRGYDLVATTGKDGNVRIFEIHYPEPSSTEDDKYQTSPAVRASPSPRPTTTRNPPSASRLSANLATTSRAPPPVRSHELVSSRFPHAVKEVAVIQDHSGTAGVFQAKWRSTMFEGVELLTSHEDGSLKIWKATRDGSWVEFAGLDTRNASSP
ncbi:MAG: epoxide hydrolase, soluble (sEH) [Peltula sp. TS41687]|nr:MAG: epoxide hydrolase, soluble (sEH) [Peltula sp. TS41687]